MKRRELLRMIGGTLALGGALLPSLAARAAVRRLGEAARRSLRAPSDLLARVRRRTRALDEHELDEGHDLAG